MGRYVMHWGSFGSCYLSDLILSIFFLISLTSSFGDLSEERPVSVVVISVLSSFKTIFFLYHQAIICPFSCISTLVMVDFAAFEFVCCFPVGEKHDVCLTVQCRKIKIERSWKIDRKNILLTAPFVQVAVESSLWPQASPWLSPTYLCLFNLSRSR